MSITQRPLYLDMDVDAVLKRYFSDIRGVFEKVLINKSSIDKTDEINAWRKHVLLLFVKTKKVNRLVKYKLRAGRQELHQVKLQVDSNRLQLQNLLYEVSHLTREIRHCYKFRSQDEDIDLLKEVEYLALRPEIPYPQSSDDKRLMRLEWELNLRQMLSGQCKELCHSKKLVFQEIVSKMERLTSFIPSLRTLLVATKPLQEALQISINKKCSMQQLFQLLPQPLYLVYTNIYSLEMAQKFEVSVDIIGNSGDIQDTEVTNETSSLNQKLNIYNNEEDADILEPHPLAVRVSIGNTNNTEECISFTLQYFSRMGFVAACTSHDLQGNDALLRNANSVQDILQWLYDDDLGDNIPIYGIENQLQKINIKQTDCLTYLNNKHFGKPYIWAQRICGIQFYNKNKSDMADTKLQKNVFDLIKKIKDILILRKTLLQQLKAVVNKNLDIDLKEEQFTALKPSCSLVQWTAISNEEYAANAVTDLYRNAGMLSFVGCYHYRAVIVRGSAKLECLISISKKFPSESPFWIFCVYWNGKHHSLNSSSVKAMEFWTNSLTQIELNNKSFVLSTQLFRTMHSFDIFLETDTISAIANEYPTEKHFIKSFSKRLRTRPYKYIREGNSNYFKQ